MPDFHVGQRVRLLGDAEVVDVNSEGQYAFEFASGNRVWIHPDDRDFEVWPDVPFSYETVDAPAPGQRIRRPLACGPWEVAPGA